MTEAQTTPVEVSQPAGDDGSKQVQDEQTKKEAQIDAERRKRKMVKDIGIAMVAGFLLSLLMYPILSASQHVASIGMLYNHFILFVLAFTMASGIGMWAAYLIARKVPVILQIARFVLIGGLNTILDNSLLTVLYNFLVKYGLEALSASLGIDTAKNILFSVGKTFSFIVASLNSYAWNKFWTFKKAEAEKEQKNKRELLAFYAVTLIGFGINVLIAKVVFSIGPLGGVTEEQWVQLSGLSATGASMVWNFVGYKFFVFKK